MILTICIYISILSVIKNKQETLLIITAIYDDYDDYDYDDYNDYIIIILMMIIKKNSISIDDYNDSD